MVQQHTQNAHADTMSVRTSSDFRMTGWVENQMLWMRSQQLLLALPVCQYHQQRSIIINFLTCLKQHHHKDDCPSFHPPTSLHLSKNYWHKTSKRVGIFEQHSILFTWQWSWLLHEDWLTSTWVINVDKLQKQHDWSVTLQGTSVHTVNPWVMIGSSSAVFPSQQSSSTHRQPLRSTWR